MELKNKVQSTVDKTIKYIFQLNNQIVEFSYIDNNSGKDIICVPCQTMCNMSCKFCHLTDHIGKISLKDMTADEIIEGTKYIIEDLKLGDRTMLISYMGCGEPLDNIVGVINSMVLLSKEYGVDRIRFGLATMLPKKRWVEFFQLVERANYNGLNLKIHLSLHFVDDTQRKEWMPAALNIDASLSALKFYHEITGNPIEVHYTIMDGVNDSKSDIVTLAQLIPKYCTIKFMRYSEKDTLDTKATSVSLIKTHMDYLSSCENKVEYYEPPGIDIGSSCGQFLLDL